MRCCYACDGEGHATCSYLFLFFSIISLFLLFRFRFDHFLPEFHLPTGPAKPPGSCTGIPVRFGRKPVGTGRIQIRIKKTQFNQFVPVYRPVWIQIQIKNRMCNRFGTVYRPVWPVYQVGLIMGRLIFFPFLFWFNFKCPKSMLNEWIFEKIWYH